MAVTGALCSVVLLSACGAQSKAGDGDGAVKVADGAPARVLTVATGGAGGTSRGPEFEATGPWQLAWEYDCAGEPGKFSVTFEPQSGQEVPEPLAEAGLRGEGVERIDSAGMWRLAMSSRQCSWEVEARQPA